MKKIYIIKSLVTGLIAILCTTVLAATKVNEIKVTGLKNISDSAVMHVVDFGKGDEISDAEVSNTIKAIYGLGFFSDVKVTDNDGIITINVIEKDIVAAVNVNGNDNIIEKNQLDDILSHLNLEVGRSIDEVSLKQLQITIIKLFEQHGYYSVKVDIVRSNVTDGKVVFDINISPGAQTKIKTISIKGNSFFSSSKIISQMNMKPTGLLSFLTNTNQYSKEQLDIDLESIENFYLNNGFIDFKVDSTSVDFSSDKNNVTVNINLDEGAQYKLKAFNFIGKDLDEEKLKNVSAVRANDIFSREKISNTIKNIRQYLSANGYVNAIVSVNFNEKNIANKEITLDFNIREGEKLYIRKINIIGNYSTDDTILRQELRQMEGAAYNQNSIESSIRHIKNLGYIKSVNCIPHGTATGKWLDLDCIIEEDNSTSSATAELGYGDPDGFIVNLMLNKNNVFGTGNKLSLQFNRSKSEKTYKIFHSWPHLSLRGDNATAKIYYTKFTPGKTNISQYHTDSYGMNLSYGIPLADNTGFNMGLGFEHMKLSSLENTPEEISTYISNYGDIFNQLKLSFSLVHSTIDNSYMPIYGVRRNLSLETAVPYQNVDNVLSYYKINFTNNWYKPLYTLANGGKFIFLSNTKLGYGAGLGNQGSDLPFFKNYFAGGIGSVRGYVGNSLGPRGTLSGGGEGNALGGNVLLVQSLNLIVPQKLYEQARVSLFFDAGNVYENNIDLNQIRYSAGVAVQANINNMLPVVFSLGFPLKQFSNDKKETFAFSITTDI